MLFKLDNYNNTLIKSWLKLAIGALAIAGIFSILIVGLRTPGIEKLIPYKDFFRIALVVHVDLSVLVWLLAFTSLLSQYIIKSKYILFSKFALYSTGFGTLLIAGSAFFNDAKPIMNNYIPVINSLSFFLGIGFFFCGSFIQNIVSIISYNGNNKDNIYHGIFYTNIINIIALCSFFIAGLKLGRLDHQIDLHYYYELLFWARGHILQFTYVNLMIIAWVYLNNCKESNPIIKFTFKFKLIFAIIALIGMFYDIENYKFKEFYTIHMRYLGGIAPILAAFCLLKTRHSAIVSSMVLFFIGGLIGISIHAINVTIPAHYHGSIVGVTLALNGLTYRLIESLYKTNISKWANKQIYLYASGQIIHISGLAWSGGYGAMRKTPGAVLSFQAKIGMGMMGFGGLLAIIAGIMFVIISAKSIKYSK